MLAYLDPGAGSALIAALTAGFAGGAVVLRMYRDRILGVFSKKRRAAAESRKQEPPAVPSQEERVDPPA